MKLRVLLLIIGLLAINLVPALANPPQQSAGAVITSENVANLEQVGQWGYGNIIEPIWAADGSAVYLDTLIGVWKIDPNDVTSGELLFEESIAAGYSTTASPDSSLIASSDDDETVIVWDSNTGEILHELISSNANNIRMDFSPDNSKLGIWTRAGIVEIWDLSSGELIGQAEPGYESFVNSRDMAFSPDSSLFYVYEGAQVIAYDTSTLEVVGTTEQTEQSRSIIYVAPNGQYIFTPDRDDTHALDAWDARTLEFVADVVAKGDGLYSFDKIAFSPDGQYFAVGNTGLWDAATLEHVSSFPFTVGFSPLIFSPDGSKIILGMGKNRIYNVADLIGVEEEPEPAGEITFGSFPNFAIHGDTGRIAVTSGSTSEEFGIFSLEDGSEISVLPSTPGSFSNAEFSADGSELYIGTYAGSIQVIGMATGERRAIRPSPVGNVNDFHFNADASKLTIVGNTKTVVNYDVATEEKAELEGHEASSLNDIDYAPDGSIFATAGRSGNVLIWDAETNELLQTLGEYGTEIHAIEFSPDGSLLVVGDNDGIVHLIDTSSWEEMSSVQPNTVIVTDFAFSPDGSHLAVAYATNNIIDLNDLEAEPLELWYDANFFQNTQQLVYNADGSMLFGISFTGWLGVWDTTTGENLLTIMSAGRARGLALNPDETMIVVAGGDGTVRYFAVPE